MKRDAWQDAAALLGGAALFGAGYQMFLLPHAIVMGGATGIATTVNLLFGLPAGLVTAAVNLPLLAISFFVSGGEGVRRALLGILVLSLSVDLFAFVPSMTGELLIAAVFGGFLTGLGLGLALLRGYTSGGSDLAAYLIRLRFRKLSMGRLVLLLDGTVILLSALILRDFSGIFYSAVAAYIFSYTVDRTVSYSRRATLALLICHKDSAPALCEAIATQIQRGVTRATAFGWYTGEGREILLCAVKPGEAERLSELVRKMHPEVFLIMLAAPQIFGYRFSEQTVDKQGGL